MTWQNPATPNSAAALYSLKSVVASTFAQQNLSPITPVVITGTGETAVDVSQWAGYEIQFNGIAASISGGWNFTLKWYNNLTDTIPVDQINWQQVPQGTGSGFITNGHGPMRGLYMVVLATNTNSSGSYTYTLQISGTTRTYQWDDWRSNGSIAGFTVPTATTPAFSNELCTIFARSVAPSGQQSAGIYMYTGRAYAYWDTQAGTGTLSLAIFDFNNNSIWTSHPGEGSHDQQEIILPRGPCALTVTNTGAAAATFDAFISADRV